MFVLRAIFLISLIPVIKASGDGYVIRRYSDTSCTTERVSKRSEVYDLNTCYDDHVFLSCDATTGVFELEKYANAGCTGAMKVEDRNWNVCDVDSDGNGEKYLCIVKADYQAPSEDPAPTPTPIPYCQGLVEDMENMMPPGLDDPVNDYLLPSLTCLCDDCGYEAFAAAMKPHAEKFINSKEIFPIMQDMAKSFCANADTVKCIMSLEGNCKPKGLVIPAEIFQLQKYAFGGLDCLCSDCKDALGKILTISEKQMLGEYTDPEAMAKDICGLYPDMKCLKSKSNCKDAMKFVLANVDTDESLPTADNFDAWADKLMEQLKDDCESKGVTVPESGASAEAGEADGAVHLQGASFTVISALVLAMMV